MGVAPVLLLADSLFGRDRGKMGTKKRHQKDGRLPIFFFFSDAHLLLFFFMGILPTDRPSFFFYDAHVLHKILMSDFWLGWVGLLRGVRAAGQPANWGIFD